MPTIKHDNQARRKAYRTGYRDGFVAALKATAGQLPRDQRARLVQFVSARLNRNGQRDYHGKTIPTPRR
jgi:hypothetical protein